jgi:hypothetical protein
MASCNPRGALELYPIHKPHKALVLAHLAQVQIELSGKQPIAFAPLVFSGEQRFAHYFSFYFPVDPNVL